MEVSLGKGLSCGLKLNDPKREGVMRGGRGEGGGGNQAVDCCRERRRKLSCQGADAKKCESVIFLLNKSKDLDSVILSDYDYWEN